MDVKRKERNKGDKKCNTYEIRVVQRARFAELFCGAL